MAGPTLEVEAISSIAAGIAALTLAALGVEPQSLVYAALGGFAGMTVAPKLGRWQALVTFASVMCLCASLGTLAAQSYGGGLVARNVVAGVSALVFHPVFSLVVQRLPEILDGVLRRLGLKP